MRNPFEMVRCEDCQRIIPDLHRLDSLEFARCKIYERFDKFISWFFGNDPSKIYYEYCSIRRKNLPFCFRFKSKKTVSSKSKSYSMIMYCCGGIATILLFWIILNSLKYILVIGVCLFLFFARNTIFTGVKIMCNPFEVFKEIKEKQEALIEHLNLEAILIPRHWKFRSKKAKKVGSKK